MDEPLAGYPVVIELPVVWGEMDSYRHVNNVVYFRYFKSARLEYFRRLDWFDYGARRVSARSWRPRRRTSASR